MSTIKPASEFNLKSCAIVNKLSGKMPGKGGQDAHPTRKFNFCGTGILPVIENGGRCEFNPNTKGLKIMLPNKEGQRVPTVTFRTRKDNEWVDVTTNDLFAGKTVVVFSLPGAFTPTCSSTHLPGYNELAKTFKANGVDEIVCISVNDTFVMNEWAKDQEADNVTLIPDGNGEFSEGMGMLVDKTDLGFGKRSWRYSMVVKDCVVDKMFIEPEEPGDPFKVSDADTMLNYINSTAAKPKVVSLFTKVGCPFCARAKAMLTEKGLDYEEIVLGQDITTRSLRAVTGATTVPQVFIDGKLIGDSEALESYLAAS